MGNIFDKLDWDRVVTFKINKDNKTVRAMDGCDSYYKKDLTKKELLELINGLKEMHNKLQ
jgi:hypothetical protein